MDREKRRKFVARYTTPAADAVTDMGFKKGIIQFGILRFWNELHDAFYDVKTGVKFFFKVVNVVFQSQLIKPEKALAFEQSPIFQSDSILQSKPHSELWGASSQLSTDAFRDGRVFEPKALPYEEDAPFAMYP